MENIPLNITNKNTISLTDAPDFLKNKPKEVEEPVSLIDDDDDSSDDEDYIPKKEVNVEQLMVLEKPLTEMKPFDNKIPDTKPIEMPKMESYENSYNNDCDMTMEERETIKARVKLFYENIKSVKKALNNKLPDMDNMPDSKLIALYDKVKNAQGSISTNKIVEMGMYGLLGTAEAFITDMTPIKLSGPSCKLSEELQKNDKFNESFKAWLIENTELFNVQASAGMQCMMLGCLTALSVHNKNCEAEAIEEKTKMIIAEEKAERVEPVPRQIPKAEPKPKATHKKPAKFSLEGSSYDSPVKLNPIVDKYRHL